MHFLFFLIACSHSNKDHEGHIKLSIILRGLFHCGRFRGVICEGAGKTPCFSTSSGSLLAQSEHYWPTSGFARGYRQIIIRNDKRRVRWIEVKLRGSRQMLSPASHSVSRSLSLSYCTIGCFIRPPIWYLNGLSHKQLWTALVVLSFSLMHTRTPHLYPALARSLTCKHTQSKLLAQWWILDIKMDKMKRFYTSGCVWSVDTVHRVHVRVCLLSPCVCLRKVWLNTDLIQSAEKERLILLSPSVSSASWSSLCLPLPWLLRSKWLFSSSSFHSLIAVFFYLTS